MDELLPDPPNGNPVPSSFGAAVALEGDRALVGDWEYTLPGVFYAGAARVYDRQETGWVWTQRLEASDATEGDAFGSSVALVADHAFVGAPSAQPAGAVYRFERVGNSWFEVDVIAPALFPPGADIGQSMAVTAGRFLVGAPGDDGPNAEASAGSVRSYGRCTGRSGRCARRLGRGRLGRRQSGGSRAGPHPAEPEPGWPFNGCFLESITAAYQSARRDWFA